MAAVVKKLLCKLDWEILTLKMYTSFEADMPKYTREVLQKNPFVCWLIIFFFFLKAKYWETKVH